MGTVKQNTVASRLAFRRLPSALSHLNTGLSGSRRPRTSPLPAHQHPLAIVSSLQHLASFHLPPVIINIAMSYVNNHLLQLAYNGTFGQCKTVCIRQYKSTDVYSSSPVALGNDTWCLEYEVLIETYLPVVRYILQHG